MVRIKNFAQRIIYVSENTLVMGQQEVYDFLMKNPDHWYTSKEISEQLIVSIGSVTMSLKKLRKTNIIKFRNTGKRNTFQYMVQSEPIKIGDRKVSIMEHQPQAMEQKIKVKIKPKIVHQHTYLGGQTFYGVIRPKEEVDAIERKNEPAVVVAGSSLSATRRSITVKRKAVKPKKVAKRVLRKAMPKKKAKKVMRSSSKRRKTKAAVRRARKR